MLETYRGQQILERKIIPATDRRWQHAMLDIEFAQISDPGQQRAGNEDYLGYFLPPNPEQARSHGWLFALADGVGGHEKGEVAAQTAVEALLAGFRAAGKGEQLTSLLHRLVQTANARVFETAIASGTTGAGMATTLVACALRYDRAVVAHVGDSRCYLLRGNHAQVLTRDHTVASEHARLGLLSEEEAADADTRHVLSRSLGTGLFVGVEIADHQVMAGDVLLLCSDGLHGCIKPQEIAAIVGHEPDLNVAARQLVTLANERDGSDNVSAQLIRVQSVERVGMYRGRPYKLR
jgi:serine/threonine protein phosphatase PrpC